jgi:hypothetical protein
MNQNIATRLHNLRQAPRCGARTRAGGYPLDGENLVWWTRLKQALGTSSSDFVNASLYQLQAAAQWWGVSGLGQSLCKDTERPAAA